MFGDVAPGILGGVWSAAFVREDVAGFVRSDVIAEVRGEAATAEIALWTLGVCVAVLVVSLLMQRRWRAEPDWAVAGDLGWGAVQIGAVAVLLIELAVQVYDAGWLTGADEPVWSWFVAHRAGGWTTLAVMVTDVASPVGTAALGVGLAGWF